jgi:FKBP-type peptidyl-prolyl cis-trans isomerase
MTFTRAFLFAAAVSLSLGALGCQKEGDKKKSDDSSKATDAKKAVDDGSKKSMARGQRELIPPPEDVAAPPADAKKTEKGVAYKVLTPAAAPGDKPTANDTVVVHYTGWTTDGKMFDSSVQRKHPARFSLSGVIPGWTEGLQVMTVGEKTRFWIPDELAYKGKPGRPQGMLVFDVELLEIDPKDGGGE